MATRLLTVAGYLLLFRAPCVRSSSAAISVSAQYFKAREVPFVTAFTCWRRGLTTDMMMAFSDHSIRLAVIEHVSEEISLELNVTHKLGVFLDSSCTHSTQALLSASDQDLFDNIHFWLIWENNTVTEAPVNGEASKEDMSSGNFPFNGSEEDERATSDRDCAEPVWSVLGGLRLRPDSEVTWASYCRVGATATGTLVLADVYRLPGVGDRPLTCEQLGRADPPDYLLQLASLELPSRRRKDHGGCVLRSATVIQFAEYFENMSDIEDLSKAHFDTWSKIHYPIIQYLGQEMNFSITMEITDSFGWQKNGSFDGLVGLVQRHEIDILGTGVFIRADRMNVLDFAADTFYTRAVTIFRQPSLSAVSNIFLLPYRRAVWLCVGGVALLTAAVLAAVLWTGSRCEADAGITASPAEVATVLLCVVCQQGYHVSPSTLSARILLFVASLTGFFLFTSYSANIVALLQTPSTSISTVADLTSSPLAVGFQDITFNHVYLEDSPDEDLRRLYRTKVAPQGKDAFYKDVSKGIRRMREGMFAFQVEGNPGFSEISRTFAEHEKCGLGQFQMFSLPTLAVAVSKRSPHREMFAVRVRWYREVGLLYRLEKQWVAQWPGCDSKISGFVSVGLLEFYPALLVLQYGILTAMLLLGIEKLFHRRQYLLQRIFACMKLDSLSNNQHDLTLKKEYTV